MVIFIGMVFFILGMNYLLMHLSNGDRGIREYRVEINRLCGDIAEHGWENIDLSKCRYVTAVIKDMSKTDISEEKDIKKRTVEGNGIEKERIREQDFIAAGDSDYLLKEIEGTYYRFEYEMDTEKVNQAVFIIVNFVFAMLLLFVIVFMLFIKFKIVNPFLKLREVPFELSKGNLTMPVKENKNRFFGRFVWGMNLLRENLEQQKQRELALQKEKKTMILSISHDIKTPLSAIKLYAKALLKGLYQDKEKQLQIAESINQKADEIERYVSDIIKAERENFLELPVDNREFYLSQVLKPVKEFYDDKLAYLNTDFYMADYTDCFINGDVERSIEVLQNVMENAIKYGDGNHICIENEQEEDCVLITIKNSGCTLNETEEPHIFDAFWRGQNAERAAGNGLGLYICKELMHKMDGEIFSKIEGENICVTVVFRMVS